MKKEPKNQAKIMLLPALPNPGFDMQKLASLFCIELHDWPFTLTPGRAILASLPAFSIVKDDASELIPIEGIVPLSRNIITPIKP